MVRTADAAEIFADEPTVASVTYCVKGRKRWSAEADHQFCFFGFFVDKDLVLTVIGHKRNDIIDKCDCKENAVDDGDRQNNGIVQIRQHDHGDQTDKNHDGTDLSG